MKCYPMESSCSAMSPMRMCYARVFSANKHCNYACHRSCLIFEFIYTMVPMHMDIELVRGLVECPLVHIVDTCLHDEVDLMW